jgi:addiction module HigA family antidote
MARRKDMTAEPDREPTHPGEVLREDVLPALGLSVSAAARRLRVTRQTLHRILVPGLNPGTVTPEMAVRLGKFCGNGPDLWLAMQSARDLWLARKRLAAELRRIPTAAAAE